MSSSGPELDLELLAMRKEKVAVPKGIYTPMCYCGDNCNLVQCNAIGYAYGMRFFMCANYAHDPIKQFGNVRPKTPPPLCDFMQWLDTEQSEEDMRRVEETGHFVRERWQRMVEAEKREEKCKQQQEEIRIRQEMKEREAAQASEADREKKRERAHRAKEAGPDAIRKGKYPCCTQ